MLSSAVAELVALSKLAMEMLGVRSMALEWEMVAETDTCQVYSDASVALSVAKRQGGWQDEIHKCQKFMATRKSLQIIPHYQKIRGG